MLTLSFSQHEIELAWDIDVAKMTTSVSRIKSASCARFFGSQIRPENSSLKHWARLATSLGMLGTMRQLLGGKIKSSYTACAITSRFYAFVSQRAAAIPEIVGGGEQRCPNSFPQFKVWTSSIRRAHRNGLPCLWDQWRPEVQSSGFLISYHE